MANYNKSVNFAVKDTLQAGDPQKIVSGAEIDTEFNNISSSSTTKIDKVSSATTGNLAQFTATGTIEDSGGNIASLGTPTGAVIPFAGSSAPSGWFFCNGQELNRSTNSELFSAIGTTFGEGDGSTTFAVPDLRDRFALGANSIGGSDAGRVDNFSTSPGDSGGSDEHQLTEAEMPSHTHTIPFREGGAGGQAAASEVGFGDITSGSAGGDQAHNNIPPFIALNYIIKA